VLTREQARELDARDPLAAFRERFVIGDPDRIYLDGNSLGRLPVRTRERLAELTAQWGDELVSGWPGWIDAPAEAGAAITAVIGAKPHEVVVCDSVTVNLYKLAMAAHAGGPLVTREDDFPTDRYVLEGIAAERRERVRFAQPGQPPCREGDGLCVLSHVSYRTAEVADLDGITAQAREAAVPLIWDLSHSAGAVEVELGRAGAELAVGCTYKYLNAGPGAPAFLYVAEHLHERLRSPIWGWFGQARQFEMERPYDPEPTVRRFLAGTPPIMGVVSAHEGARLVAQAGIRAIREKSVAQTSLLIALADEWLAPLGFEVASPRAAQRRGSHVALRHEHAWAVNRALIERAAVVPDFRDPDLLRLGIAPLYTRFTDVWDAMDRLRGLVERGEHLQVSAERPRVT
jgi:kynureninase